MDAKTEERRNLAANCGQIFSKGPALTKEIITKVQRAEIVNERKYICGYEFKSRDVWVLTGLFVLFALSLTGTIAFWFTNVFDIMALSNLEFKNGSESYESFMKPAVKPLVRVHIFNYTNVDNFEKGIDSKLHVKDVGPYVFQETLDRINPSFDGHGMLSFQERRSYNFLPQLSNGHMQSDRLVVPNLPLFGVSTMVKDEPFLVRFGIGAGLNTIDAKPFLNLPAHRFIWGYDDKLFTIVKNVLVLKLQSLPFEKFGLLVVKNGTSPDRITINTGSDDINDVGKILKFNGEEKMNHWSTDECNRIDGTLGAFFSPLAVRAKQQLNIYQKEMCRKVPLVFQEEITLSSALYPAYRYAPPATAFAHPDSEPNNQCFCHMDSGACAPHGVINATPCAFGPAYLSFPHFYQGDPMLLDSISGLNPNEEEHGTYVDIHPVFGYTMAARTRLQLNVQVKKANGILQVSKFKEDTMLPIAWFDSGVDVEDLPQAITDIYYKTSFTVPIIEIVLRYVFLLMTLVTFLTIILIIQARLRTKQHVRRVPPFQRNISGLSSLIQ